jgi:ribonuclease J
MKVTILKGSHEIGGTCIRLSSGKTSILLDAGLPLSPDSQPVALARLSVDALLVSHPHQDHFGLMASLPPGTPVYIGRLARSLIDATQVFIGKDRYALDFHDFKAWQPFTIGDFTITPYLVDHSATDAYAFLIEAKGKRLFYSGDLRSHGRKGILFENLVKRPIHDIDLLFLEGTMLHRSNDQFPDETAVENTIFETIRQQKNISFLLSSSQNIDRIVSAYRACKRAGKLLVIDIYTAWVPTPKLPRQILGELVNQLVTVSSTLLSALFQKDNTPPNLPIGRRHDGIDVSSGGGPGRFEQLDDSRADIFVVLRHGHQVGHRKSSVLVAA